MPETSQLEEARQPDDSIEQLETQLATLNQEVLAENSAQPRHSRPYKTVLITVSKLAKEYRKQNDFDREMRLYQAQQNLFSQDEFWGERESVPWEMHMGICCVHYKKNEDALKFLESAFQKSQSIFKDLIFRHQEYVEVMEDRPPWSMHWTPVCGKLLCRLYMDASRKDNALAVASTCYTWVRNHVTEHPPIGKAFEPAFNIWMHWTEICGRIYLECGQKYMAKQIYEMTIQDLKRFNWDSPVTEMFSGSKNAFLDIFKRKLERLGLDSDDEESDEDSEPQIAIESRLQLITLKPSEDPSAPIECSKRVFDIAKAPPYKALSYAWGNSRKVISYTRKDGPPYADGEESDSVPVVEVPISLDGHDVKIRQTLYQALQSIRLTTAETTVWIDALCTQPAEMKSRAAWALQLKEIYKGAEEVVIWLGEGTKDMLAGMAFLEDFWEERPKLGAKLGEYLFGEGAPVPWEGLCKLFRAEWWTRVWTVQEFLTATKLSVQCGNRAVHWRNLLEFTTFVDREWSSYKTSSERSALLQPMVELVRERHQYICLRDEYIIGRGCPLEELWQATKRHESWDPRDKIYALIGVTEKISAKHAPKINYDFCPCAVFTDMIVFRCLGDSKALADRPLAESRKIGGMTLLGYEQSDSDDPKHIYTWDSTRIDRWCDGENCGRRLKCFSDGIPEFPSRWSMERAMKHMKMMYDAYVDMKKTEVVVELLAQKLDVTQGDD